MTIALAAENLVFFILALGGTYALNSLSNDLYSNMSKGPTWKPVVAFVTLSLAQIVIAIITFWLKVLSKIFPEFATQYSRYLVDCCRDDKDYEELKEAMEQWRSNDHSRSMNDLESLRMILDFKAHEVRITRKCNKVTFHRCSQLKDAILQPFLMLMVTAPGTIVINVLSSYISDLLKNEEESTKVLDYVVPVLIQIAVGFVWWLVRVEIDQKAFEKFQSHVKICSLGDYEQLKRDIDSQWYRAERGDAIELEHLTDRDSQSGSIGDMHSQASEANDDTQVQKGPREPISQAQRRKGHGGASSGPPVGIKKLNDSLYQLYAPRGVPQLDIILFHGLHAGDYTNAYWKSWMSADGKMLWPQTLLGEKFPTARILSVSYDSATKERGTIERHDLHLIAENYVADIIFSPSEVGVDRPVVLVGHSLGGLLLKKFILSAYQMKHKYKPTREAKKIATIDNFLANVCGVFYYSTPHNGTGLADIVSKIPGTSKVLAFLQTLSKDSSRLNEDFARWRKDSKVKATSLVEGLHTDPRIWGVKRTKPSILVEERSCRNDTDSFFTVYNADHITVCQPNHMIQSSFGQLEHFLIECLDNKGVVIRLEEPLPQGLDEDPR